MHQIQNNCLALLWKRLVLIKHLFTVNISSCKVLFKDGISLIGSGNQWVATGPPCSELIHRDMRALITHCVSNLNHYICKFMTPERAQDPHISRPRFFKPTPGCTVDTLPVQVYKNIICMKTFHDKFPGTTIHSIKLCLYGWSRLWVFLHHSGAQCVCLNLRGITQKVELISKILHHPYILHRFFSSNKLSGCITGPYFQELLVAQRIPHPLQTTADMALQIRFSQQLC